MPSGLDRTREGEIMQSIGVERTPTELEGAESLLPTALGASRRVSRLFRKEGTRIGPHAIALPSPGSRQRFGLGLANDVP